MKVEVESLDKVRKNIEVIPDREKVEGLREEIYDDLKKKAKIRGFRPGKAPRSVITSLYKDYIEDELKKKVFETTMVAALSEAKVIPIVEPQIRFSDNDPYGYRLECEVEPEFELPVYEGIQAEVEKTEVTEDQIAARIRSLQDMHAQLVNKETDGPAQKGDYVIVKYEGFLDGQPVKDVQSDAHPVDLGTSNIAPEFEAAILGLKTGEEREFEMTVPADHPSKEIASKTLTFKLVLKEIKEKKLPDLNDDFAKDLSFETMDQLKNEVRKELEAQKEVQRKRSIASQISDFLVANTDIPVPPTFLQRQIDSMIQNAKSQMKTGSLNEEQERNIDTALRKECEPEAEKRIKIDMILAKISEQQGITVEDTEVDDRLKKIADDTKRPYDYVRDFYDKYNLTDNLKSSMLAERTMTFLVEKATIKEKE
jgi:trigger factor